MGRFGEIGAFSVATFGQGEAHGASAAIKRAAAARGFLRAEWPRFGICQPFGQGVGETFGPGQGAGEPAGASAMSAIMRSSQSRAEAAIQDAPDSSGSTPARAA